MDAPIEPLILLAALTVFTLLCALVVARGRRTWARDRRLTEVVCTHAAAQVRQRLGKPVELGWLRVLRVERDRAIYALGLETTDGAITARAALVRRGDGSVAISTRILAERALG